MDILDGKNFYIKKKVIPRKISVEKIDSNDDLSIYLYPKSNFSVPEKKFNKYIDYWRNKCWKIYFDTFINKILRKSRFR